MEEKKDKLNYLEKKIREIDSELRYNQDVDFVKKVELQIELYEMLMEKAKLLGEYEKGVLFKKKKLQAELEYIDLIENQVSSEYLTLKDFLSKEFEDLERVKTDIKVIDDNLGGMPIGVMVQFGAASGAGKTTTLMRMGLNMAKTKKVAHFNFEMSERLLYRIYDNMVDKYIDAKSLDNLYLIHNNSSRLEDVIKDIKLLHYKEKVDIFIIDSRMKITTDEKTQKDSASKISKELSKLVRMLGITIILINQLSEEAIKENRIVLKESGDQFYDADLIFGLGFKYEYEIDSQSGKKKIKKDEYNNPVIDKTARLFKCEKNRLGEKFTGEISIKEIYPKIKEENYPKIKEENSKNDEKKKSSAEEILPEMAKKDKKKVENKKENKKIKIDEDKIENEVDFYEDEDGSIYVSNPDSIFDVIDKIDKSKNLNDKDKNTDNDDNIDMPII